MAVRDRAGPDVPYGIKGDRDERAEGRGRLAFEAKLQPILAASAAGALRSAGAEVSAWDADVCPNDFPGGDFDLVLISIPSV